MMQAQREFWSRYAGNKRPVLGLIMIIVLLFAGLLSPLLVAEDPNRLHLDRILVGLSDEHPMGTDYFGRDVYGRIIWGARTSLAIGLLAALISAVLGTLLGSVSGYFGGNIDELIMRTTDTFLVIPTFFLVLLVVAMFGSNLGVIMVIIGLTMWPGTARLIRAEFLALRDKEFVEAARSVGAGHAHIIFHEVLPNAIFPATVNVPLQTAEAILIEAGLSFLGLGDPNYISWGRMLNDAIPYFRSAWWMAIFPGIAISIAVLSFNLIGEGLTAALNPRFQKR